MPTDEDFGTIETFRGREVCDYTRYWWARGGAFDTLGGDKIHWAMGNPPSKWKPVPWTYPPPPVEPRNEIDFEGHFKKLSPDAWEYDVDPQEEVVTSRGILFLDDPLDGGDLYWAMFDPAKEVKAPEDDAALDRARRRLRKGDYA